MRTILLVLLLAAPVTADDLARELPRVPATEAGRALETFRLHAGFRLEQVAAEPLVTDPVAACFDADGRLYVVEMRGYPYPQDVPSGRVTRLEDSDGDGRFDRSTVFLDDLSWPTSVVPYDGGVFVAVAPEIVYAKDADGDGRADERRAMSRGFGTGNVQALVNGLLWGPDGWIYGVGGGNGGEIVNLGRPGDPPVSVRGRDFRFKPDGSAFEAASGGGQFGHAFDDWGHRFTCNNSNSIRQIVLPARYVDRNPGLAVPAVLTDIAVEGGAGPVFRISPPEPWRVVRTRQRLADPQMAARLAPTEKFAFGFFTSATGVTIYRGNAFPPEYRGNAFIGDVGGNLVHRAFIEPAGPIYRARRADEGVEFLASADNWFRPVNFANTPAGTLLILDMYRETIEHPASIPDPIKRHLDLTSGYDRGRLYEIRPEGFRRPGPPRLGGASTVELVGALARPEGWWRETAQRLLIERRDPGGIAGLKDLARRRPTPLARFHALGTLDALGGLAPEDLLAAFADAEPGVREHAARLSERFVREVPEVRQALLGLADDSDAMVRFQAALSIGEIGEGSALAALGRIARRDASDPWMRLAVLSSVAGRAAGLLEALAGSPGFAGSPEAPGWLGALATLAAIEDRPEGGPAIPVRRILDGLPPAAARTVLLGLGRGYRRSGRSLAGRVEAAVLDPMLRQAAETAAAPNAPGPERVEAVQLIGIGPPERALELLPALIDPRQPTALQLAAIAGLSDLPDPRVGALLAGRWPALGPVARREAAEALLARPERRAALLDAVEAGTIAPGDLEPARRQQLLAAGPAELRERAGRLLSGSPRSDRGGVIDAFRPALERPGGAARGREVFRRACATCHRAEGEGRVVGPDLATVASRTAEEQLIQILDPNREVAPAYLNYTVATTDGRVLSGLIAEETAAAVTLRRAEGAADVVPRDQIEDLRSTGLSLMPENLETQIDPAAMADLIAFLRGLKPGG